MPMRAVAWAICRCLLQDDVPGVALDLLVGKVHPLLVIVAGQPP
jgi:hypothetical protein